MNFYLFDILSDNLFIVTDTLNPYNLKLLFYVFLQMFNDEASSFFSGICSIENRYFILWFCDKLYQIL